MSPISHVVGFAFGASMKCAVVSLFTVEVHVVPSAYAGLSTTYVSTVSSLSPV